MGIVAVSLWEWEICTRPKRQKKCGRGGRVFLFFFYFGAPHSKLAHAAGFSLGMHWAPCDPVCENQIDVSHCRSHRRPLRSSSSELLA